MNTLEILLLLIGIIVTVVSFLLVAKSNQDTKDKNFNNMIVSDSNDKIIAKSIIEKKNEFEESIKDINDQYIEDTKKELNQTTNEKMIVIQEFADQLIDDIKNNKEEVFFLYQILNEKENTLRQSDISISTNVREQKTEYGQAEPLNAAKSNNIKASVKDDLKQEISYTEDSNESEFDIEDKKEKYKKIIGLYNQGNSITEISKTLSLGQGEVKLYIDINKKLVRRE
ncbi:MAG TPA: hypothetical protein GX705_06385 [Clostridiales bacterium]|nr:hypothetical protein [Clostridiales bacterium]